MKNTVISEHGSQVVFLSATDEGKKRDKIADEESYQFPAGSVL